MSFLNSLLQFVSCNSSR